MQKLIDRYVIPIYNINNTEKLCYKRKFNSIEVELSLKTYRKHPTDNALIYDEDLNEVFKYAGNNAIKDFNQIMLDDNPVVHQFTKTLMVVDIIGIEDIQDYDEILSTILDSIHLSIPRGISYYKYFSFKSYRSNSFVQSKVTSSFAPEQAFTIHSLHSKPYSFSPMLKGEHYLKKEDFKILDKMILNLYELYTMKENQYARIIKLSIEYHKLSITFEKIEQTFLVLMICIEAMFKKSDKIWKDITYVAKLLSDHKDEYNNILYKFKKNESNKDFKEYYIEIRNAITHGDEMISKEKMQVKILELHEYTRQSIIGITKINMEKPLLNYYYDLFNELDKKFPNI